MQLNEHMQKPYEIALTRGPSASIVREQSGRRLCYLSETKTNPIERGVVRVSKRVARAFCQEK